MKKPLCAPVALLLLLLLLLGGCAGAPQPDEPSAAEPRTPLQQDPESVEPQPEIPMPEVVETAAPDEDREFEVSDEVFERTFSEVEQIIGELNTIIARRDYQRWLNYLTPEYHRTYSDPQTLREISQMPILRRNEIKLESLRDYFEWVVGPSRADARLDDLRFIRDGRVEALMVARGQPVILYRLRNVDGNWKVDVF